MIRTKWLLAATVAALSATPVLAGEGWYFGGYGGITKQSDGDSVLSGGPETDGVGGIPGDPLIPGGFVVIPGILTLFPGSGIPGSPGEPGVPGLSGNGGELETSYKRGWGVGGSLGYQWGNGIRTELELGYRTDKIDEVTLKNGFGIANGADIGADGDLQALTLMGNVWYNFNHEGVVQPYIGGGVGVAQVKLDHFEIGGSDVANDKDVVPAFQGGAGLDIALSDRTTVGLGYRYLGTKDPEFDLDGGGSMRSEYQGHMLLASARYRFTDVAREEKGLLDTDGDGVPDINDKCPNTPAGAQVGADGCPLDSDGDGVPDYLDQCPNTPAGTQVDAKGCPLSVDGDEDGDGVPDSIDQCPGTPPGTKVLPNGCTEMVVEGTHFEFDKTMILPDGEKWLQKTADTLRNNPDMRIEVAGHTDSIGSDDYNYKLSLRRAQSVMDFLGGLGVPASQLEARGYGESQPVADNDSEIGRWRNRRVSLKVLNP